MLLSSKTQKKWTSSFKTTKLPKFNQDEIDNLNSLKSTKKF